MCITNGLYLSVILRANNFNFSIKTYNVRDTYLFDSANLFIKQTIYSIKQKLTPCMHSVDKTPKPQTYVSNVDKRMKGLETV